MDFAFNNSGLEKSLTMKQYRCSTNNSDGVFVYRSPFNLRSFSVQPPFELRSFSVRAPFILRSSSVRAPFNLRSSSVRAPFGDRRSIEEWSKKYWRIIGGKTEMYRNSNGKPRERRFEQKLYFWSLKFKLIWHFLRILNTLPFRAHYPLLKFRI